MELMQAEDYALKTLSQLKIEFRIKEPSGKIRWSSIVSTPKKLVNGSICFDGIEFVITEIKTAEKALIDSEIKYRSLIEGSSDVIFCVNEKGEYQFTNMIFATAFGRTPDYFIGKTYWDVYPKEDADRRQVATSRVYKSAISETLEISVPLPNETKYFLAKINPIKNSEGKVIFVLVNSTDITDRKLTEEKLKENNSLIKSIFEADPTGVSLTVDRVFFKANKQFFKITGYSENEIIGQNTRMLYPDEFEYNRVGVKLYDDLMLNGVGSIESKWLRKDGVMIDVQLSISPLDPLNFKSGLTSVVFDISERKQAEREKIKLEAQLHQAQKMESIGRLAGGIAHDFNNMLGVILGHSELAVKYSNVSPELINSLLEIRKAAEHSATLTRQLLAFSRNQTVVPKVLNLNDTVSGMIKMLERLIGEDIKFVWKPDESIWLVKMDPSQVDQILANLCINARDAISGVGAITVETGNSEIEDLNSYVPTGLIPGKYVKISVSDNGCGIDKDNLEHIFEPFFTTKEMGKGTGLGLATVYGAVKQNHGFVNVYSEVGIGTTFTIYLPRYDGHGKTANIESTNPKFQHGKETILLVEDETGILDVTTKMLEIQGYLVIGANNPIDALRLAKEHGGEIRLLITDMIMPEMNGRDLAAKVTTIYPHIKCLFMSGYIANIIVENGILDDDVHFIQKPFTMNDLSVKVREVLDSQKPDSE